MNNAGITGNLIGNLTDVPAETVRRVIDVNVTGLIYVCQEAVRRLSTAQGRQRRLHHQHLLDGHQGGLARNLGPTMRRRRGRSMS